MVNCPFYCKLFFFFFLVAVKIMLLSEAQKHMMVIVDLLSCLSVNLLAVICNLCTVIWVAQTDRRSTFCVPCAVTVCVLETLCALFVVTLGVPIL